MRTKLNDDKTLKYNQCVFTHSERISNKNTQVLHGTQVSHGLISTATMTVGKYEQLKSLEK